MKYQGKIMQTYKIIFWVMKIFFNIQWGDIYQKTSENILLELMKKLCW